MNQQKNGSQTRLIIAITLIVASFLSAFLLSKAANQTQLVWSARSVLIPGSRIASTDVMLRKVALPVGDNIYLSKNHSIANFRVIREVRAGELIPVSAITDITSNSRKNEVPISILNSDSPSELHVGQIVNIYHVGDPHLVQNIGPPVLIVSRVYVLGIDSKNQNIGGNLSLTLLIDSRTVLPLLKATSSGRIVLVRVND